MNPKSLDTIFMSIFLFVGILLFIGTSVAISSSYSSCKSKTIDISLTTMLALSTALITLSVSYLLCNRNADCYTDKSERSSSTYFYSCAVLATLMAIILALAGSNLKGECALEDTPDNKRRTTKLKFVIWSMFSLCVLLLLLNIGGIYYTYNIVLQSTKADKKEVKKVNKKPKDPFASFFGGIEEEKDE